MVFRIIFSLFFLNILLIAQVYAVYDELFLKNYLKSLKSISIEFEQISENGIAKGILLIQKPYNFRCDYSEGSPLLIVGNAKIVSVYDYDLDELSNISRKDNRLRFIVLNDLDVDKLKITEIIDYQNFVEFVSIDSENNESSITLSKSPLKLEQIKFYGFDKNQLTINFGKITEIMKFDQSLFSIKNPKIFGPPLKNLPNTL